MLMVALMSLSSVVVKAAEEKQHMTQGLERGGSHAAGLRLAGSSLGLVFVCQLPEGGPMAGKRQWELIAARAVKAAVRVREDNSSSLGLRVPPRLE